MTETTNALNRLAGLPPRTINNEHTNDGRRLVGRYIRAIPLLWLGGVMLPAAMGLLLLLSKRNWPKGKLINTVVAAWILIGIMQAISALLNSIFDFDLPQGAHTMVSIGVYGWIMGGLGIAVGHSYRLACRPVVRAITIFGAIIIVFAGFSYAVRLSGVQNLEVPTPVSLMFPKSELVRFYATATFFVEEDNAGEKDTRLSLFSPWAVSLGLGGVAIALISSLDKSLLWRSLGMAGGLVATVSSLSRIAMASLLVVLAMQIFLRLGALVRLSLLSIALLVFLIAYVSGFDPVGFIDDTQTSFDDVRAGSSMVRDMIYEENWSGFWQSPLIGNGWPGESVTGLSSIGTAVAPIGTHSSLSGLLYTGGALTFGIFVVASLVTIGAILWALLKTSFGSEARRFVLVGLCLMIVLLLFTPYESLFADTLPHMYIFVWIGGVLGIGQDHGA